MKRSQRSTQGASEPEPAPTVAAGEAGGTRAAILNAATRLLTERGLSATRTRDVTALAGLSTGLLNHYFTWQALRAAALERVLSQGLDALLPLDAAAESDPRGVVDALAQAAFSEAVDPLWRLWIEAIEAAPTDPLMAGVVAEASAAFVDRLAATMARGVSLGLWHCPDTHAAAFRLAALHDGLIGMLLSGLPGLTRASSVAHWRAAFALECAPAT